MVGYGTGTVIVVRYIPVSHVKIDLSSFTGSDAVLSDMKREYSTAQANPGIFSASQCTKLLWGQDPVMKPDLRCTDDENCDAFTVFWIHIHRIRIRSKI